MTTYRNQRLFSDYYLQELLPETSFWKEVKEEELQKTFDEIRSIYQKQKTSFEEINESQLEERFIRPILRRLDHIYEVNISLPRTYEGLKHPDYAFYSSEETKKAGIRKAVAIGEAKRYGRPLDRKLKTEPDPFEVQNPSLQISRYLWISEVPWGILTDGRFWRLYERETSKRLDIFYEIDLFKIIKEGTLDEFKYFYLFFCKEAFPDFLRKVYDESLEYAKAVGEELKENVYKALKILAEGFLKTPANNLSTENLKEIHDNCHIFLYRLLFIFYAEARGLLPLDNEIYRHTYSLNSLKNEIKEKMDVKESISPILSVYWDRLKTLFDLVNKGSQSFGIPKEDMYVPPYNGGLFDSAKHPLLEKYKVADKWIVEVIDLLARSPSRKNSQEKAFVDYSSLEIRHLGSIYEGLLEYKLRIAEKDIVPVKEKGKEVFVPLEEARKSNKRYDEKEIVRTGELYAVTDKGERKATGSYYTPDYIVDYIIENTLKPLCDEITNRIHDEISELEKKVKESRGVNRNVYQRKLDELKTSFDDEVLKLKVLDPAMGSGHFLVRATEYLAEEIATNPYAWDEEAPEGEAAVMFWRRRVVERCIYGVDLNPLAVELAKLSLWLSTVAKDKPLSFLDHHLRCGNSLIGARVKNLSRLSDISKKKKEVKEEEFQFELFGQALKKRLPVVLGDVIEMLKKPSDKVEQIREKENIYNEILNILTPFKEVANVWTSVYFGNERIDYDWMLGLLETPGRWKEAKEKGWFKKAEGINKEKRFFHWELEFPELFFDDKGREKDNPGFDAVVGNPPYVTTLTRNERNYFFALSKVRGRELDTFYLFSEKAIENTANAGYTSYILPNVFFFQFEAESFRTYLLKNCHVRVLLDLGFNVFGEATVPTAIFVIQKGKKADGEVDIVDSPITRNIIKRLPQTVFSSLPYHQFDINFDFENFNLVKKIETISEPLSRFAASHEGVHSGNIREKLFTKEMRLKSAKKMIKGSDIDRYHLEWGGWFVNYDPSLINRNRGEYASLREEIIFLEPKIYTRQTSDRLIATYDAEGYYSDNTLHSTQVLDNINIIPMYLLALLNSKLLTFFYQQRTREKGRVLAQVKIVFLRQLPIRRISFTTSFSKRKKLFEEAKGLYENSLKTNNWDSILLFIQQRLSAKPEESDVVHDLLAFLAEKMIEYNKDKGEEIKSFLKWLERGIGAEIENLTNKTAIKNYHEGTIDDLLEVLRKNKNKLKIDPTRREFQDKVAKEFTKSISKLSPLKQEIEITDKLIDQIVYKLYRLTEEEIKLVEKYS
jgi:type I restriction-modification system DNA methylase subunit